MKLANKHIAIAAVLVWVSVLAVIAIAKVYADAANDTIEACYNNTNGELRRVNSAADCRNHETSLSWNVEGPAGPPGPGSNVEAFRHTRTAQNECVSPSTAVFSVLDHASTNDNPDALIFVTALIRINDDRTNNNPNSNLLVIYTGNQAFGACPAGRWLIGGGDVLTGAQYNVTVVGP